jgi:outer membrane protein TolC
MTRPSELTIDPARMPTRDLAAYPFDAHDGLDEMETAMVAVVNSPDLTVLRDDLGIAHAESFAAGLLPDPQLTASQDFVTGNSGGPGATNPYGLGISYDVGKLLTYSSRTHAADWTEKQVDLNLLWAEWQTVAQSRLMFTRVLHDRAVVKRLLTESTTLDALRSSIEEALAAGHLSADLALTGLNAAADTQRQLIDARAALSQSEHGLRQLLGFAPEAPLVLVERSPTAAPELMPIESDLQDLPRRRPDLLALRAGYESQNERLRAAILEQFPAINIGFNRARDNAGVYTSVFAISMTLPLFDRNRGNVAIQRATRERLRDDYAARWLASQNEVVRLREQLSLDQAELPVAARHAAQLDLQLRNVEVAWLAHQLDLPTYLGVRSGALSADTQLSALRQITTETAIALQTLLGADWSDRARATLRVDTPSGSESNPR